jgi:hypothetical protein
VIWDNLGEGVVRGSWCHVSIVASDVKPSDVCERDDMYTANGAGNAVYSY